MKGICAIDISSDKVFFSLATSRKSKLIFLKEAEADLSCGSKSLVEFLKENGEALNEKIKENEKKLSIYADKVYLNLPPGLESRLFVEASIPLKKNKRITPADISYAKKYLEDAYVAWEDICLHHLVLNYEVEGNSYKTAPLGVTAKRVKIKSLLIVAKNKLYRDIDDILYNFGRKFCGFVFQGLSIWANTFEDFAVPESLAACYIGYDKTYMVIYKNGEFYFSDGYAFGLRNILEELSRKLLLPFPLAEEIFNRYVSFKEMPPIKEVSIKNGQQYISLSTNTANSFVKDYLRQELGLIFEAIKPNLVPEINITFSGRLNLKAGLADFLKGFLSYPIAMPLTNESVSLSFGCLRYGLFKFLEREHCANVSFINRIVAVYKEYF
jgi:cell division ATPase FtsA